MGIFNRAGQYAKSKAKALAKKALLKLLISALPVIIPVAVLLLILSLVGVMLAGTFSAMAPGGYMKGVNPSPEDQEIIKKYEDLVSVEWNGKPAWNVNDCYVVGGESFGGKPYYPAKTETNLHALKDKGNKDYDLRLKWGTVHAVALFWAYNYGTQDIPDSLRKKIAEDIHPYFYYMVRRESTTVSCPDGSSTETWDVYLLVEAYTIYGHYLYHYEPVTRSYSSGKCTVTTTTWELKDSKQILPDRYQRIKDYLVGFYGIKARPEDVETARAWVMEAGEGFTDRKEWYGWILQNLSAEDALYIRGGIGYVPPEIKDVCKEMEKRYGVPWWLIAGVVAYETRGGFQPDAFNEATKAAGLGQITPETWRDYAQDGNGDGVKDVFSIWDNLATVAKVLIGKGYRANMSDDGLLPVLAAYGGDPSTNAAREYARECLDWVRQVREAGDIIYADNGSLSSPLASINWGGILAYLKGNRCSRFGAPPSCGHAATHAGIDIPAEMGEPVLAVANGIVVDVHYQEGGGGNMLTLVTGDGVAFTYMHLSGYAVTRGPVRAGQVIAYAGSTGRSTGPHLHFEVHPGAGNDPSRWYGYYTAVDPVEFFTGISMRY
jgi:hypothetical protein